MRRHLKIVYAALAACAFVAACATDSLIKDTRQMMSEGRSDEALAALEKAIQEEPRNAAFRQEFLRQRDYAIAQWLVRAESLRSSGKFDAADELYQRVLKYDRGNARATQGLAQTEIDRRHRALVAEADRLVKAERYRDAQDILAPVLTENPAQREARQLQRLIDEKTTKPAVALLQLSERRRRESRGRSQVRASRQIVACHGIPLSERLHARAALDFSRYLTSERSRCATLASQSGGLISAMTCADNWSR